MPVESNSNKFLIWDIDNTLGYREGGWAGAMSEVTRLIPTKLTATPENFRPFLKEGFPWHSPEIHHSDTLISNQWWSKMSAFFSIVFQKVLNIDEFEAAKYARWVRMTYLDTERWRITNDAIPALNELGKLGWQHYMLTNHVPELGLILRNLLRKNYFLEVICSAEIGYEKPHPEAFKSVLKSIPEGATIWMIGDNYQADVIGAEKAGIPAILVRTYNPSAKFFSKKLNGVIEILQDNAKV